MFRVKFSVTVKVSVVATVVTFCVESVGVVVDLTIKKESMVTKMYMEQPYIKIYNKTRSTPYQGTDGSLWNKGGI